MNAMKKEKIVDKIIDALEVTFFILFLIGTGMANDYNPLWLPIVWTLGFASLFYSVYRVDEWRTWQKEERERRRQERLATR